MNTKNKSKNKKGIGIILAAIMLASVFAAIMPTASAINPSGELNITGPVNGSCVCGMVNITWTDNMTLSPQPWLAQVWYMGLKKWDDYPVIENYTLWNSKPNNCIHTIRVYNETFGTPAEITVFVDNTPPEIKKVVSPVECHWYNCSGYIDFNVSATDSGCDIPPCGVHNVTVDLSKKLLPAHIDNFVDPKIDNGILTLPAMGDDWYNESVLCEWFKEFKHQNITITALDNATDKDGKHCNNATYNVSIGNDLTAPDNVTDLTCNDTPGAIVLTWTEPEDWNATRAEKGSGVVSYNIYVNETGVPTTTSYDEKYTTTTVGYNYTDGTNCENYTFVVTAVDLVGHESIVSNNVTCHYSRGFPEDIIVTPLLPKVEANGTKIPDFITATVKDAVGSGLEDVEVCFNVTDGQVCPTKNTTDAYGAATVAYTPPKYVDTCEDVTITAWVCDDDSIINTTSIKVNPAQATGATLTASPTMIAVSTGTSTITVQLVDANGNPAVESGVSVTLSTTEGTLNPSQGFTTNGKFVATLTASGTPTRATITADVGGLYIRNTTVDFVGYGSYDIQLYAGWNLISLPLVPEDDDARVVLSGIANELDAAWAYDGCEEEWTSGKFVPGPIGWAGDLTTMEVERGYWLDMNAAATLTVTGYTMTPGNMPPPTLDVCKGWNLVGYYALPPDKVMSAYEYFTEVEVSYKVLGFNNDGASQGWITIGEYDDLYSGKGYWMNAKSDGEITPQEWV